MAGKPVLVFDLDGTIAGDYVNFESENDKTIADIQINPRIFNILKLAYEAREAGRIDAIFLLTNNSDIFYISMVDYIIGKMIITAASRNNVNGGNGRNMGRYSIFDDIMSRNDNRRPRDPKGNPPKRLEDVQVMLEGMGLPLLNLSGRVFFFDDIPDHAIGEELTKGGKYIVVQPPYTKGVADETDFEDIERILTSGGYRLKNKSRKSRKSSKIGKQKKGSRKK